MYILAVATALKQAATPEFKVYQQQTVANCKVLAKGLMERGYTIVSGLLSVYTTEENISFF